MGMCCVALSNNFNNNSSSKLSVPSNEAEFVQFPLQLRTESYNLLATHT